MSEFLGKQVTWEHPPALRHSLIDWLLPWPGGKLGHPTHQVHEIHTAGHFEVVERQRVAVAKQVATSIRMHGIDSESGAMLGLLESLLAAGEIAYEEYFRRVENLFPHQMAVLDQSLKQKISALVAQ